MHAVPNLYHKSINSTYSHSVHGLLYRMVQSNINLSHASDVQDYQADVTYSSVMGYSRLHSNRFFSYGTHYISFPEKHIHLVMLMHFNIAKQKKAQGKMGFILNDIRQYHVIGGLQL